MIDQLCGIGLQLVSTQLEQLDTIELEMGDRFTCALAQGMEFAREID
ncbi:hypothetical protein QNM99_25525 [Pseudomonas sp. PCH446]